MLTRRRLGAGALGLALARPLASLAAPEDDDAPPNVFISPAGKPFRAKITEPYPVSKWFAECDKDADGRIERAEFIADAEAFFKTLDRNGDGVIDQREVSLYERYVAPEVLGLRVSVNAARRPGAPFGGRLIQAQVMSPGNMGGPDVRVDPEEGQDTGEDGPRPQHDIDEAGQGASPYGFFDEPEPVMAADEDLNGRIRKEAFLRLAGRHFDRLDSAGAGVLSLAGLPKTALQTRVEAYQKRRRI